MNRAPDMPTLRQVACLLLASVGLGLAGNALHPAGLRWAEANAGHGADQVQGTGPAGVYRNETLYENETVSERPALAERRLAEANSKLAGDKVTSLNLPGKDQSLLTSAPTFSIGSATLAGGPGLAGLPTQASTPRRSTWAEVKALVESGRMVLVDARPRTAFDAGHIPGAVCLPFKDLQAEVMSFMAAHPPSTPLAIYCANAKCGTSSQMATALTQTYQYKDVCYLPGGYQEWRSAEAK